MVVFMTLNFLDLMLHQLIQIWLYLNHQFICFYEMLSYCVLVWLIVYSAKVNNKTKPLNNFFTYFKLCKYTQFIWLSDN